MSVIEPGQTLAPLTWQHQLFRLNGMGDACSTFMAVLHATEGRH